MFGGVRGNRLGWRESVSVFVAGSVLTVAATALARQFAADAARRELDVHTLRLSNDIRSLVLVHTALLSSLRGLFGANAPLTRAQFHDFVTGGRLLEQHPGAQALEYARRVAAGDVASYESSVAAGGAGGDGYPPFRVHPESAAEDRWVVEHVEPIRGNEAAYGLDLGAETSRRAAIEAACAGDRSAATNPIRLVQETGSSPGLVVFAPVYDVDPPPPSALERRSHCAGLMIVVYRTVDMLSTVERQNRDVAFRLVDLGTTGQDDGTTPSEESPLFDTRDQVKASGGRRVPLDFHGRRWELIVDRQPPSFGGLSAAGVAVGVVGTAFSGVVSLLVLKLATFRSRALAGGRVVAAGDRDRRSLERDLHDGAQQRLLTVSLVLAKAQARVGAEQEAATLLSSARDELARSMEELRALAQGLHPAVLSDHGLAVAAQGIVARAGVPVDLKLDLPERLPQAVEVAGYYVVCEALANAVRHASATTIAVSIWHSGAHLCIDIRDDGVGGASARKGSGLRGLADRVEALDGWLSVTSTPGGGTWIRARIPSG